MNRIELLAIALALSIGGTPAFATETIKIGVLLMDSGPLAASAQLIGEGAQLAVDTINAAGGVGGKNLEIVTITHPPTPAGVIDAATRAVKREGAKFLIGSFTSSMGLALSPKLDGLGAIVVDPFSRTNDLTGKSCQPNYFRENINDSMIANAIRLSLDTLGASTWDAISVDYAAGHDFTTVFGNLLKAQSDELKTALFAPFGTPDFGSYISQLAEKPAQGLAVTIYGSDAIALANQQKQFGLFDKYHVVLGNGFTNELNLPAQGDGTVGVYEPLGYISTIAGDQNAAFVKAFEKAHNRKPVYFSADGYASIEVLAAAIKRANSATVDDVRRGLEGLQADTVVGPVEMRAGDHQLVRDMVMAQVVKDDDGSVQMKVTKLIKGLDLMAPVDPECHQR
jgi:branched-chain amino acid transport system substrate-binding protein